MPSVVPQSKSVQQATPAESKRLTSIDAYRGFVMFLMAAEVLNLRHVAEAKPASAFWKFLAYHQTHVEWVGCSLHDLIQPSFSFLVGVALPFSLARRVAEKQPLREMLSHAFWRSVILVLLGVGLRTIGHSQIYWTFEDTLSQIGLGYFFLFLLARRSETFQWAVFTLILFSYWTAFAFHPLPGPEFDYLAVGVPNEWSHMLTGFQAHWNKNSNLAWAFDTWFLNLFPRERPFAFNGGGYATLSFIPTLATMILGLITGGVLRSERNPWDKVKWLGVAGVMSLLVGAALGWLEICPVVKRIWTPSWVLFSGGWCFLLLAAFYAVIDAAGKKRWSFPLAVIGMNSLAAYCLAHVLELPWVKNFVGIFAAVISGGPGSPYETLVRGGMILILFWLILFVMHREKLHLRI